VLIQFSIIALEMIVWLHNLCYAPFEALNKSKLFPFLLVTPLPYAVGTCAEHIRHSLLASNLLDKKLILIRLWPIYGLLKFQIASSALYTLHINQPDGKRQKIFSTLTFITATIAINTVFILFRILYLTCRFTIKTFSRSLSDSARSKIFKSLDGLSFPRVGIELSISAIANTLAGDSDNAKEYMFQKITNNDYTFTSRFYLSWSDFLKRQHFTLENKYIVLHVRSPDYHSDFDRRNYRNADIQLYLPLISLIASHGYRIVLIGDTFNRPLQSMANVFDFRHGMPGKPCSLDLYLVSKCTAYIGMMSGPMDVALLFSKPMYILNAYLPGYCFGYAANATYVLKHHSIHLSSGSDYGLESLARRNIPLAKINDSEISFYELSQLSDFNLLNFGEAILREISLDGTLDNNYFNDVTHLAHLEQNSIKKNLLEASFLNREARVEYLRYFVNTSLSRSYVRIIECNSLS